MARIIANQSVLIEARVSIHMLNASHLYTSMMVEAIDVFYK